MVPAWYPRPTAQVPEAEAQKICERRPRPEPHAVIRCEWPCGNLLRMEIEKLGCFTEPGHAVTDGRRRHPRRVGWE